MTNATPIDNALNNCDKTITAQANGDAMFVSQEIRQLTGSEKLPARKRNLKVRDFRGAATADIYGNINPFV